MAKPEKTALEQFAAIDAAVWFDIARNGFRLSELVTMRDRRMALQMARAKLAGNEVSEPQARYALRIREKIKNCPRPKPLAPFERPKTEFARSWPNAVAAARAANKKS